MKYYDYCILSDSDAAELSAMAAKLGWNGICILSRSGKTDNVKVGGLDVFGGLLIETDKAAEVRKEAMRQRKKFHVVAVSGSSEDVNRAAVETPEVDILLPQAHTKIDYVMAKLARENGVSIGFEFRLLLHSSGRERSRIFSAMTEHAKLVRKFRSPFVITSGALSEWDMRAPSEMQAFGRVLGLDPLRIIEGVSDRIILHNRKRLGGKYIAPGVEVE